MPEFREAVDDFLGQERIAVAGVSRSGKEAANFIYRKLRDHGYRVFAVNPRADRVEGEVSYPNLRAIPERPDAVLIATPPDAAVDIVSECAELGISRVWMHRSFGDGSVSAEALERCLESNMTVIPGACPMMYLEPDLAHRCMRWVLGLTGKLPSPA